MTEQFELTFLRQNYLHLFALEGGLKRFARLVGARQVQLPSKASIQCVNLVYACDVFFDETGVAYPLLKARQELAIFMFQALRYQQP